MPGGLDDGHQEVWSHLLVRKVNVRGTSSGLDTGVVQWVIRELSGGQVLTHNELMHTQALGQDCKV